MQTSLSCLFLVFRLWSPPLIMRFSFFNFILHPHQHPYLLHCSASYKFHHILVHFPSLSSSRCVCSTAPWRRRSWFSVRPGRRVRPGPVTCGSPWDPLCPVWAWRGCQRPCSPSGRRAGGTSRAGKMLSFN